MHYCFEPVRIREAVQERRNSARAGIDIFGVAVGVLAAIVLLPCILLAEQRVYAADVPVTFNIQKQTTCETEMLHAMGAREIFSGKGYTVLTEVALAYGRKTPHIYISRGSQNIFYIASSTYVDGRGKIVAGGSLIKEFDTFSLKGFLGHEMAHLVSDRAEQGCNDYILRDLQIEADADGLAARTLGTGPVKAFLQRVLELSQSQDWEAKHRLELLPSVPIPAFW